MKKIIPIIVSAVLLLSGCSGYNSPDVDELMDGICLSQGLENMTAADDLSLGILFDISLDEVEDYSVKYSSDGGYADLVAIFKMNPDADTEDAAGKLKDYKSARYEDFKGYAPLEAEKVENGKVMVYDRYVLLVIVPDIAAAEETINTEFTK